MIISCSLQTEWGRTIIMNTNNIESLTVQHICSFVLFAVATWQQTSWHKYTDDCFCKQRKQEAHGPHRSPEKQFKSINTYDYIIMLIKRRKKPLLTLWDFICPSFEQTSIPITQGCILPSLVEIGPLILEKKIFFLFRQCIITIL